MEIDPEAKKKHLQNWVKMYADCIPAQCSKELLQPQLLNEVQNLVLMFQSRVRELG